MTTFMFRPVTRHRLGNLWFTEYVETANVLVIVGDNGVLINAPVGAGAGLFLWEDGTLAGRTHRLQLTSSGVVGDCQVVSFPSFQTIIAPFSVIDAQVLDLTIPIPAGETSWLFGTGTTTGVTAGFFGSPSLTDISTNDNSVRDTQRRSKVVGMGSQGQAKRGSVFADRLRGT